MMMRDGLVRLHFSGKNMRKNKDENIDIQRFTAKER